ncbi:MAG TPA: hypothetical protein PKE45_20285, partial [Caldilineaceae bacterium]|nr:hypothetical protein [Caldilineaceae bacterium]
MSNIAIRQSQVDQLLALIRQVYPDWQNFNHPRFVADEIGYKRKAVELMHTELSHSEFERLLSQNALDEIVQRLEKVARATNLLYQSTPQTGDLRILYADAINRGDLCRQLFHLLHDSTGIDVRLQRYLDFVSGRSSALNYWTFPTYFLFLLYPDQEMFVKPTLSQRYLTWFGLGDAWTGKPSVAAYTTLVQLVQQIKDALRPYEPHDL